MYLNIYVPSNPGHYCEEGTTRPVPCAAGTYNALTKQVDCTACPIGYFCEEGTSEYESNTCPKGLCRTGDGISRS